VTYDLAVLGGGTAGLVTALGAATLGARVCLIERDRTGGDCLWTGCVPSKSLLAAAHAAHRAATAQALGIHASARIDPGGVFGHIRNAIATIEPHDAPARLAEAGIDLIGGVGVFTAPGRITIDGNREVSYRRAVIATGSAPALPAIAGLADARPHTSDTIWGIDTLPRRLVVLGGGPIGCELGQAFARLGSDVTLIEVAPRLLIRDHPDAGRIVQASLERDGVAVRTGEPISDVHRDGEIIRLRCAGQVVEANELLVATGRTPRTPGIGFERVGVELTSSGHVRVDGRLRTSASRIYAAGDVTGAPAFTHVAGYHGGIVAANAVLGARRTARYEAVPRVTYTDPEVAQVGLLADQARERFGRRARIVRFEHAALDRAITDASTEGFTELVADGRGRLVGATIVGAGAGEVIALAAAAIRHRERLRTLAAAVHAYPTRGEGIQRAALEDLRRSAARLARPAALLIRARRGVRG
jgi:pyruvate/2-oxoglutarate dehydrogenase complex dihydrolipoamide dehydrogenase (E3) component